MIKKYRKKPVEIEAIQYTGKNDNEIIKFTNNNAYFEHNFFTGNKVMFIKTLEGNMQVSIGDFVIKGVNGEFYPCKPDIFARTYEEVK